jgi:hypothetical protein
VKSKPILIASIAALGCLAAASFPNHPFTIIPAHAECTPGTPIDKTTVDIIRDRLIKAGYKNPLHLRKGCDNSWHGTALQNGEQVNVAVTPDGHIVRDGD